MGAILSTFLSTLGSGKSDLKPALKIACSTALPRQALNVACKEKKPWNEPWNEPSYGLLGAELTNVQVVRRGRLVMAMGSKDGRTDAFVVDAFTGRLRSDRDNDDD